MGSAAKRAGNPSYAFVPSGWEGVAALRGKLGSSNLLVPIAVFVMLSAVGLGAVLYFLDTQHGITAGSASPHNVLASTAQTSGSPEIPTTEYAVRLTHMRNAPTSQNSVILGTLQRGDSVTGTWVTGGGGTSWLKAVRPGEPDAYVWGRNLSAQPRPSIASFINRDERVLSQQSVHAEPDASSNIVGILAPDSSATVIGTIGTDWAEVALHTGGVGYIPTSAVATNTKIDQRVVWPNAWDLYNRLNSQCQQSQSPNYIPCVLAAMQPSAPTPQASAFMTRLNAMESPGWASSFMHYGPVDLVAADYPFRANTNGGYLLVNGTPDIVNVEGFDLSAEDKQRADYRQLMAQHPDAFFLNHQGFVAEQSMAGGGQRFLFVDVIGTCRACDVLATAEFAYEFDDGGRLLRTRLLGLLPPEAANRLVKNALPAR